MAAPSAVTARGREAELLAQLRGGGDPQQSVAENVPPVDEYGGEGSLLGGDGSRDVLASLAGAEELDSLLVGDRPAESCPLDFVRTKVQRMRNRISQLEAHNKDLMHQLSVIETAREWGDGKLPADAEQRVKEISVLLHQARQARTQALNFSRVGRGELFERIRQYKQLWKKEVADKSDMKARLQSAFESAKDAKRREKEREARHEQDREKWKARAQTVKEELNKAQQREEGLRLELQKAKSNQKAVEDGDEAGDEDAANSFDGREIDN